MKFKLHPTIHWKLILWKRIKVISDENQKGINTVQWCSIEHHKGIIAIDIIQQ